MAHERHSTWAVILGWFIANLLAVAIISLLPFIHPLVLPIRGGMFVSSLIIGLPIGLAQWMALRRVAPISLVWIFSISFALPLALVIINSPIFLGAFGFFGDESAIALIDYAVIGLVVGLIQWVLLRGHFAKSFLWALVSSAGLGLGIGLVLASDLINQSGIAPIILVVLVYAIATGSVISWIPMSGTKAETSVPSAA
jgi:hypothetical protein